ncbi:MULTISPECIES: sugar ABC transporter substrate-binding protein [unclassified Janthinobacterium]|uniref:sugar ABC transporter substrate-binding protein n=1 Tax=unclassified Janthinobacterium TaxID=2610881 RepID=UPI0008F47680|nr:MULTISPECIES: sugar ABC transporter substrate-binding protein [unclassified Janthinobacterium]APA68967.1 sugar ABC transporter substrate-binding protein [Janthinobacterium sp. 1_2014MBL_MicDiv]MDN2710837.1 sugar ABC transporter substrate-binding protein [Janthinobacterium sp. SUN118]
MHSNKSKGLMKCLAIASLGLGLGLSGGASHAAGEKFVMVSHAPDSDSWWNTIKNSIKQAGEDFNVTVDYRNPPNGDLADMARLIEQSAARNYDGLIADIADFSVLQKPLGTVVAKKIMLVTINSGTLAQSEQLKAIMHVGQPEYDAGLGAGKRAKEAGIKSFVCVNHYAMNASSFERCRGFADALGVDFKSSTLDTNGVDPGVIESKVSAYLRSNPKTQAVLALGPDSAPAAMRAVEKLGLKGKMYFASFDLSEEIAKGIKDGSIQFAIDQQPYLQGYIPVAVMAIMKQQKITDLAKVKEILIANPKYQARLAEYGLTPIYGPRHISSGPGFVTKENIAKVEKYAGQYR